MSYVPGDAGDKNKRDAAVWTDNFVGVGGLLRLLRLRDIKQATYEREAALAMMMMQEAIVPDFLEPFWKYMLQKPADELLGRESHGACDIVCRVAVGEGDLAGGRGNDACVGESYAIDVAAEISHGALSCSNGFTVNNPFHTFKGVSRSVVDNPAAHKSG